MDRYTPNSIMRLIFESRNWKAEITSFKTTEFGGALAHCEGSFSVAEPGRILKFRLGSVRLSFSRRHHPGILQEGNHSKSYSLQVEQLEPSELPTREPSELSVPDPHRVSTPDPSELAGVVDIQELSSVVPPLEMQGCSIQFELDGTEMQHENMAENYHRSTLGSMQERYGRQLFASQKGQGSTEISCQLDQFLQLQTKQQPPNSPVMIGRTGEEYSPFDSPMSPLTEDLESFHSSTQTGVSRITTAMMMSHPFLHPSGQDHPGCSGSLHPHDTSFHRSPLSTEAISFTWSMAGTTSQSATETCFAHQNHSFPPSLSLSACNHLPYHQNGHFPPLQESTVVEQEDTWEGFRSQIPGYYNACEKDSQHEDCGDDLTAVGSQMPDHMLEYHYNATPSGELEAHEHENQRWPKNSQQREQLRQSQPGPFGSDYQDEFCELCGAKFTGKYGKGNLGRHVREKHSPARSVISRVCRKCGKLFERTDARRKHEWKKHRLWDSKPKKRQSKQ